jgi:ribosome-associated translation inhibitor RaiA
VVRLSFKEKKARNNNNNMTFESAIALVVSLITILGAIYKVASVEKHIYTAIDEVKDNLSDRLNLLSQKLDLHIAKYEGERQLDRSQAAMSQEKIEDRLKQLRGYIRDVQEYLAKTTENFKVRRGIKNE